MGETEAARNQLYNKLLQVLGPESTEILMSSLPPTPRHELATTSDLMNAKGAIEQRIDGLDRRIDRLDQRIDKVFTTQLVSLVTLVAAIFASNAFF